MSYFVWQLDDDIPLSLQVRDASGNGVTGLSPDVAIRRYRDADGTALDNYYWDGVSDFQAAPTFINMTEVDAVNNPGSYEYLFEQTSQTTPVARQYLMYFRHTLAPVGFAQEIHVVAGEHAELLQEFAQVKDGDTSTFDGTRDSLRAFRERAMGMLQENIILDQQTYDGTRLLTARLRLFDSAANVPATGGGSEVVGKVGEYTIEGQYDVLGRLDQFRFTRIS